MTKKTIKLWEEFLRTESCQNKYQESLEIVFMIILLLNAIEIDQLTKFDLELDMYLCFNFSVC